MSPWWWASLAAVIALVFATLAVARHRDVWHTRWHHALTLAPLLVVLIQNMVRPTFVSAPICFVFGITVYWLHRHWLLLRAVRAKRIAAEEQLDVWRQRLALMRVPPSDDSPPKP